jgi:predicted peptidase
MKRIAALFTFWGILMLAPNPANAANGNFLEKVRKGADGSESKYVVFIPSAYKADGKPFPAILFLHGAGETGSDGIAQATEGIGPAITRYKKPFPFIVVMPQSHKRSWKADTSGGETAIAILEEVANEYKLDPSRTYLAGLSMGGYGTWSLAAKYPERWAAIVPICGGGDPKDAEKIKDIPCWCFHGDKDQAVPVQQSREMIEALKKAGGKPEYTEYKDVGHNSWDPAYRTAKLYDWLLEQKRK